MQGSAQGIPSFMVDNRYNRGSCTGWLNEYSKQVSLKDSLIPWHNYMLGQEFSFDAKNEAVETWGRGHELPGVYIKEHLPSDKEDFLMAIKSGKSSLEPLETAHRTISMCQWELISIKIGSKLNWNSEKEEIIGNSAA